MNPLIYIAGSVLVFLIIIWLYLRSISAEGEFMEGEIEDDDDIKDVNVSKKINND